jgi:hypothetical protein
MDNIDVGFRLKGLAGELKSLAKEVGKLKNEIGVNELWDNADMVRYWKVSTRTLATWRAEGSIKYVQFGNKIWYPREARELFIATHLVEKVESIENKEFKNLEINTKEKNYEDN